MALGRSATVQTLLLFLLVFGLQSLGDVVGLPPAWFALSLPLDVRPWTLVLAVYAHAGPTHLVANGLGLLLLGPLVERRTTGVRFHAFFVGAGALAGVAEVVVTGSLSGPTAVLGASGAVFALAGYTLAGNRLVRPMLDRVKVAHSLTLALFVVVAAAVTVATAAPGLALVAHFVGLLVGLLAGRLGVLRVDAPAARSV